MENIVRHIREQQDEQRARNDQEPITDRELANVLLSMKLFSAAEALLAKVYADR